MKMHWKALSVGALCVLCFLMGGVLAQEGKKQPAMPEWRKPTQDHADLKRLAGEWDIETQWWLAPGKPSPKGRATATMKSILNGYFVEQVHKTPFFEGRMILGFDTIAQEYVSVWIDSTSPHVSVTRGKEKAGVITLKGQEPDRATGKKRPTRILMHLVDDDKFTIASYVTLPDGNRMRQGMMTFTRKKK